MLQYTRIKKMSKDFNIEEERPLWWVLTDLISKKKSSGWEDILA